jgi:flagellar M-ring protein FliF
MVNDITFVIDIVERVVTRDSPELLTDESGVAVSLMNFRIHCQDTLTIRNVINDEMSWEQYQYENSADVIIEPSEALINLVALSVGLPEARVAVLITERQMFVDSPVATTDWQGIILAAIMLALLALLAFGLIRKVKPVEEVVDLEPVLDIEDMIVTTRMEDERMAEEEERQRLQDIAFNNDSEVKKQIDKFVTEKPEAAAQLLRSWINDGWE